MTNNKKITVSVEINKPIKKVWEYWTKPNHIVNWNFASYDWECPSAINDLKPEGHFIWKMSAKDGSVSFDFSGKYLEIVDLQAIKSVLDDGRKVEVVFSEKDGITKVVETFEAEQENSLDLQKTGWQAILENFKKYVEQN